MGNNMRWVAIKEPFFLTIESVENELQQAIEEWNALPQPRYQQEECEDKIYGLQGGLLEKPIMEPIMANAIMFSVYENSPESSNYLYDNLQAFMHYGQYSMPELCRETVTRELKNTSKSDLSNSGKEYIEVLKENKNDHVFDFLGLVLQELQDKGTLTDQLCEEVTEQLKDLALKWRKLDVPKTAKEESYLIMKEIANICFQHGAFRSCLILSPIYMISGKKCQAHYEESLFFVGKVLYELGYLEYSKNCLQRVIENVGDAYFNQEENQKYKAILTKDTALEMPQWVKERDADIQRMLKDGEAYWVPNDEFTEVNEKMRKENQKKAKRDKTALQAILDTYASQIEQLCQISGAELHEKANNLKEIFGELGRDTEEIVTVYRLDGEEYLKEGEFEKAKQEFDKAFSYTQGRYSSDLMKDFAELADHDKEPGKAKSYRVRAEVLKAI